MQGTCKFIQKLARTIRQTRSYVLGHITNKKKMGFYFTHLYIHMPLLTKKYLPRALSACNPLLSVV